MTDYVAKAGDRIFVFGATSMFEYRFEKDDDDNELLDLYKVWQARHLAESNKDALRASMRSRNEGNIPPIPQNPTGGNDYVIIEGDRVFVFGTIKMFEYRWNIVNGNELLDVHKEWESDDLTEDVKDALRATIRSKNEGKPIPVKPTTNMNQENTGIDAILDKKGGGPPR